MDSELVRAHRDHETRDVLGYPEMSLVYKFHDVSGTRKEEEVGESRLAQCQTSKEKKWKTAPVPADHVVM